MTARSGGRARRTALFDVGLRADGRGQVHRVDLDEAGVRRFTRSDATLAPKGRSLVQAQIGLRPGESPRRRAGSARGAVDVGFPAWREREVWRRRAVVDGSERRARSPRPHVAGPSAIDRGDGVWLCGDFVAAPGLLRGGLVVERGDRGPGRGAIRHVGEWSR